jgi:hypothetical protein
MKLVRITVNNARYLRTCNLILLENHQGKPNRPACYLGILLKWMLENGISGKDRIYGSPKRLDY